MKASEITTVIERAIRLRHIVALDYTDRHGHESQFEVEPYGYRTTNAGHHSLWVWNLDAGHWEDLFPERIGAAVDTGRSYSPRADWETAMAAAG